eukprot:4764721-Pyramimonas_sp.AAC.1
MRPTSTSASDPVIGLPFVWVQMAWCRCEHTQGGSRSSATTPLQLPGSGCGADSLHRTTGPALGFRLSAPALANIVFRTLRIPSGSKFAHYTASVPLRIIEGSSPTTTASS